MRTGKAWGAGLVIMKKAYTIPHIQVFDVETRNALLQMSLSEKEISDNYGLVKENSTGEWANIWNGEEDIE